MQAAAFADHTIERWCVMVKVAFVVLSASGSFWDGEGWVADSEFARRFDGPSDAYADASLAASCLRRLGHACSVGFLWDIGAAPLVMVSDLPGPKVAVILGQNLDVAVRSGA
jgi:hypothetical protein